MIFYLKEEHHFQEIIALGISMHASFHMERPMLVQQHPGNHSFGSDAATWHSQRSQPFLA